MVYSGHLVTLDNAENAYGSDNVRRNEPKRKQQALCIGNKCCHDYTSMCQYIFFSAVKPQISKSLSLAIHFLEL